MKIDAVVIKDKKTGLFTGFIKKYPGVCSQSDNLDTLRSNLEKYLKHWFMLNAETSSISDTEEYSF